ncbi:MAG TPA: VVA0879 family protein [Ignavibacteriales bacterium]|nr:VVA0879 family protein [Ignavibacteriales bacterium]
MIEKLKEAVMKDCKCFNPEGCDKEKKCFHAYCDKYKWIMDRAKQYADFTGKTVEEVITVWESKRNYWYMNYYQECNQPDLSKHPEGINVLKYEDWKAQLIERFGENGKNWKFVCPSCGNVQSLQDFLDQGIKDGNPYYNCIGRHVKGIGCNYTLGGLIGLHKTVVVKDLQIFPVFEMAEIEVKEAV